MTKEFLDERIELLKYYINLNGRLKEEKILPRLELEHHYRTTVREKDQLEQLRSQLSY